MGLGRNFLNAVVTQVGRDTGRVISNSVYGDAHSIPIRRIGTTNRFTDVQHREISEQEARVILDKEDFKQKELKSNLTIAIWFILSFALIGFGPIIHFGNGISKLMRKTTTYRKTVSKPYYTQDRRYRTGQRLAGYTPETIKIKMPVTESERKKLKDRGVIQIILGCAQLSILLLLKNLQ